ncbi:hypothetical protein PG987_010261 [Apiospora arundinis]
MLSTKKLDPAVLEHISRVCQFSIEEIEDVYPCTPLQEAVIAHPSENAYNHCIIISLSPTLEPDRLCSALHQVVRENSILRTRIVECGIDILQVVTSASPDIRVSTDTLEDVLAQEKAALMTLGTPLMRMVIASGRLILTLHHALGDGWAVHAFLDDVSSVYYGRPSQSHASFKLFVEYLQSFEKAKSIAFWANRFTGTPAAFPSVSPGYYADASAKIGHQIHFSAHDMDISIGLIPSYLEAAWALTSKVYSGSGNVAFGLVLSGRTPALGPVQSTLGPTIATVPVQVDVDMQSTIRQMIKTRLHTRRELTNSPALQYGLQNIRSISDAAQLASNFSTLLSISSPVGEDLTYLEDMKQEYEYDRHGPYCIGLVCVVNDQGVSVDAAFDPKVICERQMRRVLAQLEHTFLLLVRSPPDTPLSQLELISNSDKMEQLQWNAISPQSNKEACLHTQFAALARKQPTETAIVSHDGTMTYEQLDTASNSLAQELRRKGLGGEKSAALIFEKSQWAIVAQLAVWKAAGVCVPIDPSYPLAQKQTILSSCKAVILLTSTMHLKEAHSLEENVICVNRHLLLGLPPAVPSSIQDHGTSPSQIAYLLYTSGSTGQSKGVLLEHGNLATSLRAFGDRIGWKPTLRVLQFAAYVWGASIIEIFGVLLFGGCVCVPSDETRLAGVEEFIVDNNVQSAILTPTMIRMISPDDVCGTLESLISAGEPLNIHSIDSWAKRLRYYNGWGAKRNCHNIQELLPIGAVGEIVVEGAGVARGYLNDGLRTAASFIVPPSWTPLSRQRSQEEALSRRMYRTGDLGKRNPDGSICHMGRKDSQVKLHGQKLDLLEIEAVLCSSTAAKACAFLRVSDEGKTDLVAVFTVESLEVPTPTPLKRVFPNLNPAIDRDVAKIRDGAFSRLPSYMIPTIWIVVEELAVTTTSKLDRRAIQNWVDDLDLSTAKIDIWARGETLSQPASPIELVLQSTWSIVLSVPALEIGRQSSFIRLGGDSISAMKVVTKCKQRGVQTSVATLLRSKDLATTAMASQLLSTRSHGALADYPVHELRPSTIPMSPYQSLSLDTQFTGSPFEKHYHSFSLRIKPGVPAVTVERALQRLALHHEILRVRFLQTPDGHTLSSSGSYFADWLHMQEKLPPVDNIYTKQHPTGVADYWHMPRSIQSKHTVVRSSITFDEEATSGLMGSCNQSMNTTPIELIQAAVIRSFRQIFIKQGPPSLLIHSDGRQFANNVTDASRAVGCFTTLLPIATDIQSDTPLQDAISMAKDAHREILEKVSEGFMTGKSVLGALQLSDVEIVLRFDAHESSPGCLYERPEMSSELAILGVVDVLAHCTGKTLVLEVSYRRGVAHQDLLELWTLELEKVLIEVASHIPHIKPRLTKSDMALLNLMGDASSEIHQHLSSIGIASTDVGLIMPCPPVQEGMLLAQLRGTGVEYWNRITTRLTPGPSQEENVDMKRLRKAWEAVCAANPILRTIFTSLPCVAGSSFQQVILKKPAALISERLAEPEEDIKSSLANMPFAQFAPSQPPHHLHLTQVSPSLVYGTLDISHALMDDRSMRLILQQISQAYRDSTSIIKSPDMSAYVRYVQRHRDSDLAYWLEYLCGARPCLIPTIDAGIEFLKHDAAASGDQEDGAMIYDAKALHSFCRAQGITMANLMSTAWAAVLQQVCGGQEVIFGCIQSQHTSQGIDERTLGPLLTMNVCRVHLDPAIRLSSILEQAKEDSLRALDHVGCPLGEIHESIGLNCQPMLFNTTMTVVGTWSNGNMGNDVLQVELLPEVDNATEYPLTVGVIYDNMKVETRLWYDRSKLSRSFIASVKNLLQAAVSTITDNHEQNTASFLKSLRRPLSMLSVEDIAEDVKQDITGQCKIDSASIEDVYPCSRSQEEAVNIGSKVGYGGLDQHMYRIDVDEVAHLRRAWGIPVRSGSLLSRFGIVQEPGGYSYMVLSLHPATYDLLMLRGIVSALKRACQGSQPLLMGEFNISSSALLRHRHMNEAMIDTQGSWDSLLKDYKDCVLFPNVVLSHPMAELSEEMLIDLDMPVSGYDGAMADVLCAAWALCLSRRTGEDKVFFGYAPDSGDLLNKEQMFFAGQPVGGIMPCGIDLATSRTRGRLLESVQHYTSKFAAFVGQGTTATSSVTNALVIHSVDTPSSHVEQKAQRPVLSKFHSPPLASIRLLTRCMIGPGSTVAIAMQYDKQVIPPDDVAILMEQYRHAIAQLLLPTSVELRELDILGPHERSVLSSWNFDGPIAVNSCIHDQFREASKQRPTAQALCTTEMEFTYAQVNDLSDRAAAFLQARGVVVGTIVPFFLEKSALAVVVMLAILKAGGVMLALDVKHPAERIAKILTETRAKLVITSPSLMGQISISLDTVPLDMSILQKIDPASLRSVHVTPSDGCYIIYTSGSTGNPKGILCTHTNLATSISSQRESIGIDESARVFQFSNFIFDIIMYDIFMTLTSGGCICMPTPHQWANDVEGAIQAMRSNVVGMTPSSSAILSPVNVPTLRTLFVGGEPVPRETAQKWSHIRLINLYGPSETTVTTSTCQVSLESATSHLSIGLSSNGCNYWVVDRVNHDRLVALGCPGELLVQGPLVARGYIRNPELTKTVFIEPPSWARDFENSVPHLSEQGGWYKTGDIVVQNADGSLTYKGRKDNQVKLRGQRVEMGEIEFHLKRHANHAWEDIAVEVIQPGGQKQDPTLVVFFTSGTGGNARLPTTQHPPPAAEGSELLLLPMPQEAHEVRSALAADMPEYMLPRFFIHLSRIPSTSTGKMDRKALRGIGLSLSHDQLGLYGCMGGGSTSLQRDPSAGPPRSITPSVPADAGSLSPGAFALRKCWAEILDLATESLTLSDNFFHKGGNSHPGDAAGSRRAQIWMGAHPGGRVQVTHLFGNGEHTKLTRDNIESITKATDFQAYMLAVGELDGRGFHNQVTLKFEAGVDETRLLLACKTLVGHHAILRTMFVQSKCQLYQIVLKSRLLDNGVTTGDERQHEKQRAAARHGEVWPRFHLEQQSEDQCPQLRISIHHAFYDAISLGILVQDLGAIYAGQSIPESPSFAQWVSYVDALDSSEAQRFWLQLLEGSSTTQLVPSSSSLPGPSMVSPLHDKVTVRVPMRALTSDEAATPAQVLQAVWAIVLSWFSDDSRDVVFANTSANRHVDFPGADRVAGPCLNLLPVRVLVEPHATLRSIIQRVRAQAIEAMPYHHVSFRSLVQQSTAWLPGTRFSSIVTYQNHESFQDAMRFGDGTVTYRLSGQGDVGDSTDVWVEATTAPETSDRQEETLVVDFLYSQLKISEARVQLMSDYLREILVSMPTISDKPVLQIYQYLKDGGLCAPARISDGAAANADATRGGRIEEDVSDDASDITAGNDQWMTVVLHAWRDVLPRAGQDGGRAGADLVTLMLLSYWYRDHGYDIQVRDLLDRRTPRGQAKLLQALSKG